MEKSAFFQEATLRICSSLEIEEAIQQLLFLLKDVMPVSEIFLQFYDHSYNALRTIARATETECKKLDLLSPLPKDAGALAENVPSNQDAMLIKDPAEFPITREMGKHYRQQAPSVIIVFLKSKDEMLGFFVLISEQKKHFVEDHLKWVAVLKEPLVIAMSNALKHREVVKLNDLLTDDYRFLQNELRRFSGDEIIGAEFGLRDVMTQVQQVSALDSPVVLLGETGVGKDVIANTIHHLSQRNSGPFITVNCGAIPDNLIDSELFGHEKGAFTGALSQKRGRFERANKGTIFLDEIGELPPAAQVRLLRVLQNKEIERVGGINIIKVDIRIIAATNRNLEEMVVQKEFREDLWFRLNVFPIMIPPLRNRPCDIPALIQHFITTKAKELKLPNTPEITPETTEVLMQYGWPGNVRELQNVIERALIVNPTGPIHFDQVNIRGFNDNFGSSTQAPATHNLDEITSRHIKKVLALTSGKINGLDGAAALLGVNPSTLRNRMLKLGIDAGKNKSSNHNRPPRP